MHEIFVQINCILIHFREMNNSKIENRVPSVELIAEANALQQNESSQVVKVEKPTKSVIGTSQETDVCDFNKPGSITFILIIL